MIAVLLAVSMTMPLVSTCVVDTAGGMVDKG